METKNFIESWHNQLKTNFLERRPNRRVDRLVYILVRDVEPVFGDNVERILLGLGRMGPLHYEERRRFLEALKYPEDLIADMVTPNTADAGSAEVTSLAVKSFCLADLMYNVSVND